MKQVVFLFTIHEHPYRNSIVKDGYYFNFQLSFSQPLYYSYQNALNGLIKVSIDDYETTK